jgi:hypothetical protein
MKDGRSTKLFAFNCQPLLGFSSLAEPPRLLHESVD